MASVSREFVQAFPKLVAKDEYSSQIRSTNNADMLSHLFRVKGEPFSLKDRPQFDVLFEKTLYPDLIIMSGRQLGKCYRVSGNNLRDCYGAPLRNPKVGDRVLAFDGWKAVPAIVSNVFHPGKKKILRIFTDKGNELFVSPDHKIRQIDRFVSASELKVGSRIASIRRGGIFGDFKSEPGRIEATAYMIGDGCCTTWNFTSMCDFCIDEMCRISGPDTCRINGKKGTCAKEISLRKASPIRKWMQEDGLSGHLAYEKFIPDWVFRLSREDTIRFVSRLWATDGRVSNDSRGFADISYCTTSRELCRGVRSLLFKLGYMNSVRIKKSHYKRADGYLVRCRDAFIIRVETYASQKAFMDEVDVPGRPSTIIKDTYRNNNRDTLPKECNSIIKNLFKDLDHSKNGDSLYSRGLRATLKYPLSTAKLNRYIEHAEVMGLGDRAECHALKSLRDGDVYFDSVRSIEEVQDEECLDIEIDSYHNFILDNICVHNSMTLSRSEVFLPLCIPQFQLLYVAPLQEQTRRYSDLYLTEAIRSCPLAQMLQSNSMAGKFSDAKIISATGHQTFANGAGIQLTYAKTSADRARGIMADMIDFDEIQDQTDETVPIISESLTSSKFGCRRFTGTAKVTENYIESLWQKSSQCEWVMKCEHCGTWAIPTLDHGVLKMIGNDGLHCLHCGKRINVRNGQWIGGYEDRMYSFRGYHIPQVVCPAIVDDMNNWQKLLRKLTTGTLATFIQENLGISYSVGQRLLTRSHIKAQSILPSTKRLQEEVKTNPGRYSFIVAGIDWGGAELSSFTVITVIGIRPNGRIDTLWARRYRGYDPDEQMTDIAKICRFYNVVAVAADAGMGLDKNQILAKRFGLPIVQMQYTRQLKLFGKNQSHGRTNVVQCWTIDKVMALDTLFLAIRNGRIFFPKDGFDIYTDDLLSPYETTTEVGGMTHRLYLRNVSHPDDFCHALCFASMVAMKLLGLAIDDMIPESAFGGGLTNDDAPVDDRLDPKEV